MMKYIQILLLLLISISLQAQSNRRVERVVRPDTILNSIMQTKVKSIIGTDTTYVNAYARLGVNLYNPGEWFFENEVVLHNLQFWSSNTDYNFTEPQDNAFWTPLLQVGPPGADGLQGPAGAAGPPGAMGLPGNDGIQGPAGEQGTPGPQGEPGTSFLIVGSVDNPGDLDPNYMGDIGDVFIDQSTGDGYTWDGTTWINIGPIQGPQGNPGPQGIQGIQGPQGIAGTAATIQIGTVTVLDPGSQPNVTNSGTPNAAVFDFTLVTGPQGIQGEQGPIGATGPQGEQGLQGIQGEQGIAGNDGQNGSSCWDTNLNGINDPSEDVNQDGLFNTEDCQGSNTDNQQLQPLDLDGTTLTIDLENSNSVSIDLASLNTDNQTVDFFDYDNGILSISLEGDNEAPQTVNIPVTIDTDDQTLSNFTLTGTTLSLTISEGNTVTEDLSVLLGTDNQQLQSLVLDGGVLTVQLEDGGSVSEDISSLQGTDDQQFTVLEDQGSIFIGVEDGGSELQLTPGNNINFVYDDGIPQLTISAEDNQDLSFTTLNSAQHRLNITDGDPVIFTAGSNITMSSSVNGLTINATGGGTNTDEQDLDFISNSGTVVTWRIENGQSQSYDLAFLQDGTQDADADPNNEEQDLDLFTIPGGGGARILLTSVPGGITQQVVDFVGTGGIDVTVSGTQVQIDGSSITGGSGTDNQNLENFVLNGSNQLSLGIEDGAGVSVDLSSLADGNQEQQLSMQGNSSSVQILISDAPGGISPTGVSLTAGTNISFSQTGNDVVINATGGGSTPTFSTVASGAGYTINHAGTAYFMPRSFVTQTVQFTGQFHNNTIAPSPYNSLISIFCNCRAVGNSVVARTASAQITNTSTGAYTLYVHNPDGTPNTAFVTCDVMATKGGSVTAN